MNQQNIELVCKALGYTIADVQEYPRGKFIDAQQGNFELAFGDNQITIFVVNPYNIREKRKLHSIGVNLERSEVAIQREIEQRVLPIAAEQSGPILAAWDMDAQTRNRLTEIAQTFVQNKALSQYRFSDDGLILHATFRKQNHGTLSLRVRHHGGKDHISIEAGHVADLSRLNSLVTALVKED